jgi:hypothetical protein
MKHHKNPFAHLKGSLIRVTPAPHFGGPDGSFYYAKGIFESSFIALLVETSPLSKKGEQGFNSLFLYNGSMHKFYLYPSEVSALS